MMLCKCGGLVDVSELTGNRVRYWCRACGRYEIKYPEAKGVDLTAPPSYDSGYSLPQEK
jgi:hypothetical protein